MSERAELEWAAVSDPGWLGVLRGRTSEVLGALESVGAVVEQVQFIVTTPVVDPRDGAQSPVGVEVAVAATIVGVEVYLEIGQSDEGAPLYRWRAPRAWLTATTTTGGAG